MDGRNLLRRELRGLAMDLATVRVAVAFARYLDGHKYDPHPMRQPVGAKVNGRGVGGRFAPKAGGSAGAAAVEAITLPEAAAAAGPGAMAAAVGGVAISREAGLYAHYMDGQAITPVLGLPGGRLSAGPPPLSMSNESGKRIEIGKYVEECDDQLEADTATCQLNAAMYGRGEKDRDRIAAVCYSSAMERYSECLRGGVKSTRTPLFSGRRIK